MPTDKPNSITAKATGLIFLQFDITSAREVPYGTLQHIQCILHGLTVSSFVSYSSWLTAKGVDLAVARDGFPS